MQLLGKPVSRKDLEPGNLLQGGDRPHTILRSAQVEIGGSPGSEQAMRNPPCSKTLCRIRPSLPGGHAVIGHDDQLNRFRERQRPEISQEGLQQTIHGPDPTIDGLRLRPLVVAGVIGSR